MPTSPKRGAKPKAQKQQTPPTNGAGGSPPLDEWYPPEAAAKIAGVSTRTLQRLAKNRQLRTRSRRLAGRRPIPLYHPEDIGKLAFETLRPAAPPNPGTAVAPAPAFRSRAGGLATVLQGMGLFDPATPAPPLPVRVPEKLWLTLPQAAELSGLPAGFLRERLRAGKLEGFKRRRWYIRRADLETLTV